MLANLNVARRLALGFGLVLLLLVLSVILGLNRLATLNDMVERVVTRDRENVALANRALDLMNEQAQDTLLMFHEDHPSMVRARITEREVAIDATIQQLEAQLEHAPSLLLLERIREQRDGYVNSFLNVAQHLASERRDEALHSVLIDTVPRVNGLKVSIEALIGMQDRVLREMGSRSLATFDRAYQMLIAFLVLAVICAVVLSAWIIRGVIRPLGGEPEAVRAVVERIARGELDSPITLRPDDRGSLLSAMRAMQENLRHLIGERRRVELALRESQARFQGLIETFRDWAWEVDAQWRYTYVGPQARSILGYSPDELIGRTPFELMPPEEAARVQRLAEAARIASQPIVALENINQHKSGRQVVLESSGQPFFDVEGRFRGYRGVDREITDRKQAEAARLDEVERLRDALVREVHHRIKNNLQTVVGLLRREAGKRPEAQASIESAIAQVQAVAVVHGLYGQVTRHSVMLCELVPAVVGNVSELSGVPIRLEGLPLPEGRLLIRESETVAVALVLNELVTNAVKHAAEAAGKEPPRVVVHRSGSGAEVSIENPGRLAADFDFDARSGIGTGLGLVRALMPVPGMSVSYRQKGDLVRVEVHIAPPVLSEAPLATEGILP
ncbi:PAS domain S-box protein [Denitromonas sp.]|uniref:PAS domain S-box protein n=1 Tax=Denitromonas sp. TaxID=2734609 RepID=UPI002AFE2412|nr:PAS domain S-box protein [Denitromonas sp.]